MADDWEICARAAAGTRSASNSAPTRMMGADFSRLLITAPACSRFIDAHVGTDVRLARASAGAWGHAKGLSSWREHAFIGRFTARLRPRWVDGPDRSPFGR